MTLVLSLIFGAVVGFALGLTGGGGSIFAVPLLVYGLSVPVSEAVVVSLASVGSSAMFGFLARLRKREVELGIGLTFALFGVLGAPLGAWIGGHISDTLRMVLFACVMLISAALMWRKAVKQLHQAKQLVKEERDANESQADAPSSSCRLDASAPPRLNSRCALLLLGLGLFAGAFAGLFGVGGGIVIVPALVLVAGVDIRRAVGTSLLVIALVSISGLAANLWQGGSLGAKLTTFFILGGAAGVWLGGTLGSRLSGPTLQKTFASAMLIIGGLILVKNLLNG